MKPKPKDGLLRCKRTPKWKMTQVEVRVPTVLWDIVKELAAKWNISARLYLNYALMYRLIKDAGIDRMWIKDPEWSLCRYGKTLPKGRVMLEKKEDPNRDPLDFL
jgi:hypothetical protein